MDLFVVLAYLIAAAAMVGVPLLVGAYMRKKFNLSWAIFAWGMIGFVLVQVIHYPLVTFTQAPLGSSLTKALGAAGALVVLSVVLGFLAGAFESVGKYLVMRWKNKQWRLDVKKVLFFGAGWGAIESVLIGLVLLLQLISYVSLTSLTPEQTAQIGGDSEALNEQIEALKSLTPLDLVPAPVERMAAFTAQIAFTLLVGLAILKGRPILVVAAIAAHTALDAGAVYLSSTMGVWAAEAFIVVFALGSLYYLRTQWPRDETPAQAPKTKLVV
ncbi:YhfC family glutamic-type intramembrane protease [Methanomassiliicoccus luminyensis]|uniref:YhfC family glutamic-type intramembrane protease n=1 Tax=Methanomassiliicoccus luminyensis TaxID=1080712 RepID=UPI0003822A83|nr:YhfC family glutamic-type intramembrane protease [Methanomassiliicoccus luminyensis]